MTMYSVDSDGNGAGKIVNANGDIYEGDFRSWRRHGYGTQIWSTGEYFKGTWINDMQATGVFVDVHQRVWEGDFIQNKFYSSSQDNNNNNNNDNNNNNNNNNDNKNGEEEENKEEAVAFEAVEDKGESDSDKNNNNNNNATANTNNDNNDGVKDQKDGKNKANEGSQNNSNDKTQKQKRRPSRPHKLKKDATILAKEREEEQSVFAQLRSVQFRLGERFPMPVDVFPGPGYYTPRVSSLSNHRHAPSPSIGKTLPTTFDILTKQACSPGPWSSSSSSSSLSALSSFSTTPAISFAHKPVLGKEGSNCVDVRPRPGPGDYSPAIKSNGKSLSLKSGPSTNFGTSSREHGVFQFVSRAHLREKIGYFSPGPAAYSPKHPQNGASVSMSGRPFDFHHDAVPLRHYSLSSSSATSSAPSSFSNQNASLWSKSAARQRARPEESTRAIGYVSEGLARENWGVLSPGPGSTNSSSVSTSDSFNSNFASSRKHSFAPHTTFVIPGRPRVAAGGSNFVDLYVNYPKSSSSSIANQSSPARGNLTSISEGGHDPS